MFLLKDLPDQKTFEKFNALYSDLDIPATNLFLKTLKLGSDYLNQLDQFLKEYGLSHGRWIILILLQREENQKAYPSTLAEKQGVTRATMTNLINSLEKDGLVERVSCKSDARSVVIQLTNKGSSKLDNVMPDYYRMVKELFEPFERQDIQKITEGIMMLQDGFDKEFKE